MLSMKNSGSLEDRSHHKGTHKCHTMSISDSLDYIKTHRMEIYYGKQDFECKIGAPSRKGYEMIKIKDTLFIDDILKKALKRLVIQPIVAPLALFSHEYKTTSKVCNFYF